MFEKITIEMADHPQAILDAMDVNRDEVKRFERNQKIIKWGVIAFMALLGIVFVGLFYLAEQETVACIGGFILVFAFFFVYRRLGALPKDVKEHFEEVYLLLHTLRDDTGRKGWVVGTLDLSGARQKNKLVRTGRSGGGKRKEYYRDPWFKANVKLVDGNRLRITMADKVKIKAGSEVRRLSLAKTKLIVNPDAYRVTGSAAGEAGVIVNQVDIGEKGAGIPGLLKELKAEYQRLRSIGLNPITGNSR